MIDIEQGVLYQRSKQLQDDIDLYFLTEEELKKLQKLKEMELENEKNEYAGYQFEIVYPITLEEINNIAEAINDSVNRDKVITLDNLKTYLNEQQRQPDKVDRVTTKDIKLLVIQNNVVNEHLNLEDIDTSHLHETKDQKHKSEIEQSPFFSEFDSVRYLKNDKGESFLGCKHENIELILSEKEVIHFLDKYNAKVIYIDPTVSNKVANTFATKAEGKAEASTSTFSSSGKAASANSVSTGTGRGGGLAR